MCFSKPKDPQMPAEKQPIQQPKDQAVAAADRAKDRLRAGSNTILTGMNGSNNALTTRSGGTVLGRTGR